MEKSIRSKVYPATWNRANRDKPASVDIEERLTNFFAQQLPNFTNEVLS